jgi:hypothetical protein
MLPGNLYQFDFHESRQFLVGALFIVVCLSTLAGMSDVWCNKTLKLMKILYLTLTNDAAMQRDQIADNFPIDLRTAMKAFPIQAQTITYAVCPLCCCTYKPQMSEDGVLVYPGRCSNQYPGEQGVCGVKLTKPGVHRGESIRIPIRPFVVQDMNSFVARMLSRPELEEALIRGMHCVKKEEMCDIKDGYILPAIVDKDQRQFMSYSSGELRLAWNLSVDWFNPYQNKQAGKHASTACIVMSCLNLPPGLRHKPENLFLAGIFPGPKEPKIDQVNHMLRPLVDQLFQSWSYGTWFSQTSLSREGRLTRSALAGLVADLPAARKTAGQKAHPACSICPMDSGGNRDLNDLDFRTWGERNYNEHLTAAVDWRDAQTDAERKKLFERNGVRWSELLRLPYWNSTRCIVIDGMHNLWLGVTKYHLQDIVGIDASKISENPKPARPVTLEEMNKARKALASNSQMLKTCRIQVLLVLCQEKGIDLPLAADNRRIKKIEIIDHLTVRIIHEKSYLSL